MPESWSIPSCQLPGSDAPVASQLGVDAGTVEPVISLFHESTVLTHNRDKPQGFFHLCSRTDELAALGVGSKREMALPRYSLRITAKQICRCYQLRWEWLLPCPRDTPGHLCTCSTFPVLIQGREWWQKGVLLMPKGQRPPVSKVSVISELPGEGRSQSISKDPKHEQYVSSLQHMTLSHQIASKKHKCKDKFINHFEMVPHLWTQVRLQKSHAWEASSAQKPAWKSS